MASFNKKTWVDRVADNIAGRTLTDDDTGVVTHVTVSLNEGEVYTEGDELSASNLNDLEDRVNTAFGNVPSTSDMNTALGLKADKSDTYTKSEVNTALDLKADKSTTYTKTEVDTALSGKADTSAIPTKVSDLTNDSDYQTGTEVDSAIATAIENKADKDGEYPDMRVGNLIPTVGETDVAPYNFRTSGGSLDIGDRMNVKSIVGGTYAVNQLVQNGDFASTSGFTGGGFTLSASNNILTMTARSNIVLSSYLGFTLPVIQGHKYLFSIYTQCSKTLTECLRFDSGSTIYTSNKTSSANTKTNVSYLLSAVSSMTASLYFYPNRDTNLVENDTVQVSNLNIIDITAMFGSTIADYIYSLEQSTAGAGVAWFRKYFPKSYYAYNSGSLQSVKTSAHKMVGFNAWDEEWELGTIKDDNGQNNTSSSLIRSKNYIKALPNTTYFCNLAGKNAHIFCYDADKNYLGYKDRTGNGEIITYPNTAYIRFRMNTAYGTTYNNDICINLHWDGERDGEYEPYIKHEYALDGQKLVHRKVNIVDLGTLEWTKGTSGNYTFFYASISGIKRISTASETINLLAYGNYKSVAQSVWSSNIPCVCKLQGGYNNVLIADHNFDDKTGEQVATALSGVYLAYEVATPFDETVANPELRGIPMLDANNNLYYFGDTCEDFEHLQIVDDFGTEEFVDNRDVAIPVGHETEYQPNLRAKLEMSPDLPDSNGDYLLHYENGEATYIPFTSPIPSLPTENGTYSLKVTVSGSTKTVSWVADT